MPLDNLVALVSRVSEIMEQYERRCEQLEHRQQALTQTLQGLTQQLPAVVKQSGNDLLQTLPGQVSGQVKNGLQQPIQDYQHHLETASSALTSQVDALGVQLKQMERMSRLVLWKLCGTVMIALLLLLGGGVWLSTHYLNVIRQNQLSAQLLQAYNRADVNLCEDGKLCANVNLKGTRYGDHGQYLPVEMR